MANKRWTKKDVLEVRGALSYLRLRYGAGRVEGAHLDGTLAGRVASHLDSMRLLRLDWAGMAKRLADRTRPDKEPADYRERQYRRDHLEARERHLGDERRHKREAAWYGRLASRVLEEGLPPGLEDYLGD